MICDLCKEDSAKIVRFDSWQVCQWCVSNDVLKHALDVESNIVRLRKAVANANATNQRNIRRGKVAKTKLEQAYAAYEDLTTAMKDLATSTADSRESLRLALAAKQALREYQDEEKRKTDTARHHG